MALGQVILGKLPDMKNGIKQIFIVVRNKINIDCANINKYYFENVYILNYLTKKIGILLGRKKLATRRSYSFS